MSKKVQFVHSYPNQPSSPAPEIGRTVFFAKTDGVYAVLAGGTVMGPLGAAPANMVTTNTDQDIASIKTLAAIADATSGATTQSSYGLAFRSAYWNGSGSLSEAIVLRAERGSAASGDHYLTTAGGQGISTNKVRSGDGGAFARYCGGTGVAPPTFGTWQVRDFVIGSDGKIWVCTVAGSPGTWASAPANALTTDSAQTVLAAGAKTFAPGALLMRNAAGTVTAEPYSDVNPPETLMVTEVAAVPATPGSGLGTQFTLVSDGRPRFINDLGEVMVMAQIEPYVMAVTGVLTVQTGKSRIYLEGAYVIESVRASVNTAPAGASIIVDVCLNGTTIYGTQANRPTIIAGANTGLGGAPTSTAIAAGQYLTVDVDQIGSTTAGSDLTVVIRLRKV